MWLSKVLSGLAFILASSALAQNNTVNLFINDGLGGDAGFAASVVGACVDQTTYAIRCTSGPPDVGSLTCGSAGAVSKKLHIIKFSRLTNVGCDTYRRPKLIQLLCRNRYQPSRTCCNGHGLGILLIGRYNKRQLCCIRATCC
jgi:hypothetical protein